MAQLTAARPGQWAVCGPCASREARIAQRQTVAGLLPQWAVPLLLLLLVMAVVAHPAACFLPLLLLLTLLVVTTVHPAVCLLLLLPLPLVLLLAVVQGMGRQRKMRAAPLECCALWAAARVSPAPAPNSADGEALQEAGAAVLQGAY
jgi:hypothetical protein